MAIVRRRGGRPARAAAGKVTTALVVASLAAVLSGAYAKSTGRAIDANAWSDAVAAVHLFAAAVAAALVLARARQRPGLAVLVVLLALAGVRPAPVWLSAPDPVPPIVHALAGMLLLALALLDATRSHEALSAAPCTAHPQAHRRFALAANALLAVTLVQVLLGAITRHTGAGLSIPDFPLAMGKLIPPLTSPYVLVHFLHRVFGMAVVTMAIVVSGIASVDLAAHPLVGTVARTLAVVTSVQVGLGAYVIWWERDAVVTTAHVVNGAVAMGLALWVAGLGYRMREVEA